MRVLLALFIALVGFDTRAQAFDAPTSLCPLMKPGLAKLVGGFVRGKGRCDANCSGCGCKGGTGYKDKNGCVGWAQLESRCGEYPHTSKGCVRECKPVTKKCAGRVLDILWFIKFATEQGFKPETVRPDAQRADTNPTLK